MKPLIAIAALCAVHAVSHGAEIVVTMNAATAAGTGASAGTVKIVETPYGLAF
jgi:Cu-Zn family superoxide dismutase